MYHAPLPPPQWEGRLFRFEKFIQDSRGVYKFIPRRREGRRGILANEGELCRRSGSYGVKYFWQSCTVARRRWIENWKLGSRARPGSRLNAAKIGDSFENVRGNQTSPPPLLSQSTTKINRAKLSLDDSTISPSVAALTRDKPFNSPLWKTAACTAGTQKGASILSFPSSSSK